MSSEEPDLGAVVEPELSERLTCRAQAAYSAPHQVPVLLLQRSQSVNAPLPLLGDAATAVPAPWLYQLLLRCAYDPLMVVGGLRWNVLPRKRTERAADPAMPSGLFFPRPIGLVEGEWFGGPQLLERRTRCVCCVLEAIDRSLRSLCPLEARQIFAERMVYQLNSNLSRDAAPA